MAFAVDRQRSHQNIKHPLKTTPLIGILALQGSIIEHQKALEQCSIQPILVRESHELDNLDGLILPGGESTTISRLLERFGLFQKIISRAQQGLALYGTCAGAILLAREITGDNKVKSLNLIDISVLRNAYGSQIESFTAKLNIPDLKIKDLLAVFIRAPKISRVGHSVRILAAHRGEVVFAQQNKILVSTFHPELSADLRIHRYFIDLCRQ